MADWPLADKVLVLKRVLEKLQASPRHARYTAAIGQNSAFPVLVEIQDTILIVDQAVCGDIIGAKAGHPYANLFMTLSAPLRSGDKIPPHMGFYGDVLVSLDGTGPSYGPSEPAKSRGEILRMVDQPTLYGGPSRFHWIENNFLYHSGFQTDPSGKVYYPVFAKTAECQSPQQYEDILTYGTVAEMEKLPAGNPFFTRYMGLYMQTRQMAKDGVEFIPAEEQLEAMRAAA